VRHLAESIEQQIDRLIAANPPRQADVLRNLRQTVMRLIPGATERVSYAMPTFEVAGQILLHYAGFKDHNSIFPGSETAKRLKTELGDMVTSKGTIQFSAEKLLPLATLKRILQVRIEVINQSFPKPNGTYLSLYDNGQLKSKGKYRDGKMHGDWQFFRRDGSLMRSGRLEADQPVGDWITYPRSK
jgi:uncharacterized protein YdhG (YjbR/CyaY superfamily)